MPTVAVIGSGFSGTVLAAHLLRAPAGAEGPIRVILIERCGRFARGVAYGTLSAAHLLNVPAGRMSAFEADPDHFLRWARARDPEVGGGAFLPRQLYGQYLHDTLEEAAAAARGAVLERLSVEAVDVVPAGEGGARSGRGLRVVLVDGRTIDADRVVLAVGNFPPANPPLEATDFLRDPRYIQDPWACGALEGVSNEEPALLIGTGLTMVDVALEIAARPGRAPIHAVSRRGLLPQAHRSPARAYHHPAPADLAAWPRTARGLLRALRAEVARASERGIDWREVVTSLRGATPDLWRSLPVAEQRRWLAHLRPFWETHRHRAAPESWARIEDLARARRLRIQAGRLLDIAPRPAGLHITYCPRGVDGPTTLDVARVINCSGPETDLARVDDPLLRALRRRGLIATDPLGLGLLSTPDGAAIDVHAQPCERLSVLGPLRRPQLWETTAVPELRLQAAALAEHLLGALTAK
ncbi:MAG: FAD/NAD(P)-binding protein [Phycisphaerales bacterium]